jgi:uncharacterized SAM-binding protein YcdF (DUF218 family)
MFFYLSKVIWFLVQPSSMLLLIFILGLVLYRLGRQKAAIRTLVATAAIYAIGGFSPLASAMILTLEQQYSRPDIEDGTEVDGIIVLGGVINTLISNSRKVITLSESAERVTEAAALAHRFPKARLVFAGGDGALIYRSSDEATLAKDFFTRVGIAPERIELETRSQNTWQNAVYTKNLVKPKPGERWILITSAFHMPRAMGCFRAAEFDVIPWPTDFRTRGPEDLLRFLPRPSDSWAQIDVVAKEWIGSVAYYLTGRLK